MKKTCLGALLLVLGLSSGCAYRHFLGLHGPSVQNFSSIHQGLTNDSECLDCHNPEISTDAPPTSHPNFKGCLKCHNDEI